MENLIATITEQRGDYKMEHAEYLKNKNDLIELELKIEKANTVLTTLHEEMDRVKPVIEENIIEYHLTNLTERLTLNNFLVYKNSYIIDDFELREFNTVSLRNKGRQVQSVNAIMLDLADFSTTIDSNNF